MDVQSKKRVKPKIGIVILNWNNFSDTRETLRALERQTYKNYELVIVDGKSSDNSTKKIKREFPQYHYIFLKDDTGYSGGNNAGIKYLLDMNVDFVLSMNNDVIMKSRCLQELVSFAMKNKKVGIVGPRMYSYYEKDLFEQSGGYVSIFRSKPMPKWIKESEAPKRLSKPYEVKKLPGALIMLRANVIKEIGLMDERFFLYYGDTDWQKRVSDGGYKQMAVPSAKAYHKVSATTGKGSIKVLYYDSRDFLFYVLKHHSLLALTYSFFKSYIQKFSRIVDSELENKLKQLKYLNLAYLHFLIGKSGKGI